MITSVLVANRGEIARRIFRTARRLGLRTIAVHSEADADAPFVREADEAVLIGPAPARESYLLPEKILAAAKATGAEAIHPGYGFLSENADFAEAVQAAGLVWVGPPPAAIRAMGLKDAAKSLMIAAGVPTTPGYLGDDQSEDRLQREADAIGYPVLIKAVAGGGGKGMRKVDAAADFIPALGSCRREAASSFGDERVLIEKYITAPRHIEVQVFGDSHGNVVHLFERDCSLQRRHQKVIEEAPAPGMDAATRAAVCEAAVKAARAVNYEGAGTIEFIADASEGLKADRIWFMEMNTRLQVEHPVTEAITGQDLVEWQLRVASGEPLPCTQDDLSIDGWAMEARLYAENPATGFLPSTGKLEHFRLPDDIRADSAVEEGGEVTPFYDPMIAKLIVHADTREAAAEALAQACRQVEVWPVKTNAAFLARCAAEPAFASGYVDTGFIERRLEALTEPAEASPDLMAAAFGALAAERAWSALPTVNEAPTPWGANDADLFGFRLSGARRAPLALFGGGSAILASGMSRADGGPDFAFDVRLADGREAVVSEGVGGTVQVDGRTITAAVDDGRVLAFENGQAFVFDTRPPVAGGGAAADGALVSPMPGRIVSVAVADGAAVTKGQPLLTLEAMKMEHTLVAPFDGTVSGLSVAAGDQVAEGVTLAVVEKSSPS
jgi:propionyl-CoA carboxylase alpha chain/3-methylcrotonyl-CoA carboxylase alpha subunit